MNEGLIQCHALGRLACGGRLDLHFATHAACDFLVILVRLYVRIRFLSNDRLACGSRIRCVYPDVR